MIGITIIEKSGLFNQIPTATTILHYTKLMQSDRFGSVNFLIHKFLNDGSNNY